MYISKRSGMDNTVLPANTPCLPFHRKRSPDGATPSWDKRHPIAAYYSIYRSRRDERLSWPGWLTYSGRLIHISGHPSAKGRAQDRESSPAKDRHSTTVPRNQSNPLCKESGKLTMRQWRHEPLAPNFWAKKSAPHSDSVQIFEVIIFL